MNEHCLPSVHRRKNLVTAIRMPPHLHPRSTATSTLFAGTLLASFVVIGIPHVFPCPRPRTGYADTEMQFDDDGRPIRRRQMRPKAGNDSTEHEGNYPHQLRPHQSGADHLQQQQQHLLQARSTPAHRTKGLSQLKDISEEAALFQELQREAEALEKEARECPVPKPRGVLGRLLGFEVQEHEQEQEAVTKRPPPAPSQSSAAGGVERT